MGLSFAPVEASHWLICTSGWSSARRSFVYRFTAENSAVEHQAIKHVKHPHNSSISKLLGM